mmetsp:Transcript_18790/g.28332  ORF Transcript_18790/g.28332 Transcript_18790/m.28332 type:complete len:177 (-) Transcript_18790:484-1014(-)
MSRLLRRKDRWSRAVSLVLLLLLTSMCLFLRERGTINSPVAPTLVQGKADSDQMEDILFWFAQISESKFMCSNISYAYCSWSTCTAIENASYSTCPCAKIKGDSVFEFKALMKFASINPGLVLHLFREFVLSGEASVAPLCEAINEKSFFSLTDWNVDLVSVPLQRYAKKSFFFFV